MAFDQIATDLVPGKARYYVYDTGHANSIGRYVVAKHFKDVRGHFRTPQRRFHHRPAALRFATRWLNKFREAVPA